jgi:hypothetical protein
VLSAVVAAALVGCGGRSKPSAPIPKAKMTAAEAALPDWAPKNPSPEFLRAAKVLKPMPSAMVKVPGVSDAENAAFLKEAAVVGQAGYEFFGALSDAQVQQFLTSTPDWSDKIAALPARFREQAAARWKGSKRLLIPVKSLTPKLRHAFDDWAVAWGKARATTHPDMADYLVMLYKQGARKDLSNVRVGFVSKAQPVGVISCVTKPDGTTDGMCSDFALR